MAGAAGSDNADGTVDQPVPHSATPAGRPPADVVLPSHLAGAATFYFGPRLLLAQEYARLLSTEAVVRGLIGPREVPRLWERHILNCAAVVELIPQGASVVDVGTGAGLPGIVLTIARPDLVVTLVEPMARRTAFLREATDSLGLNNATVVRARAEECVKSVAPAEVVTARAVAPLDRLVRWCLPLAARDGKVLALKGASAVEEVETYGPGIERLAGSRPVIRECGRNHLDHPTTVIEIVHECVDGRPDRTGTREAPRRGPRSRPGRTRTERGSADA
jgi:16S rRNA (guanine527-N7)-methyltransferase